jgi:hypothetical protein
MPLYFPFLVIVLPFLIPLIIFLIPRFKSSVKNEFYFPLITGFSILTIVGMVFSFLAIKALRETEGYNFNGIIEKAYYEKPKEIPHITIKGVEYDLGGLNYPDYDTIVAGDSAIKQRVQLISD